MSIEEFKRRLIDQGYGEAKLVSYKPSMENEMHAHDFSASLWVFEGELTLITKEGAITHLPWEDCQLDAGILHSERAGLEGTTFLVGKK